MGGQTWLFTIARNLALSEIDQRTRRPGGEHDTDALLDSRTPGDPVAQLVVRQQIERLRTALLQLSVEDRMAIALFYVQVLSANEAAAAVNCLSGTFRTRLSRARRRLAKIMQQGELCDPK